MSKYTPETSTLAALLVSHGVPFSEREAVAILKDERALSEDGLRLSGAGLAFGRNVEHGNVVSILFYNMSFNALIERFFRKRIPAPTPKPDLMRHEDPAPSFDDFQSKGAFYSMGAVIKRKNSTRTSRAIFSTMAMHGMIGVNQRRSETTGEVREYKVLINDGVKYGKNNKGYAGKGTSMVFYVNMFDELMGVLYGQE